MVNAKNKKTKHSVHLAFRAATTGYSSALLKVHRDTGWERENGQIGCQVLDNLFGKWQTRETLARGVYSPYTPLHTNGKEINGT